MNPKQTTVKLRLEFGPGTPADIGEFHQPPAIRAILQAFSRAIAEERLTPQAVFRAQDDGVTAELSVIHFSASAQPGIPTTHHLEWSGPVRLEEKPSNDARKKESPWTEEYDGDVFFFPADRSVLEAIKKGQRRESMVPIFPGMTYQFKPGARVTFVEARSDPLGEPIPVPGGERLTVTLTKAADTGQPWAGRVLYSIAWNPAEVTRDSMATLR